MKRAFIVSLVVSLIAIASSACDSSDDDWGYASGYGRSFCGQYDSCGTCTPVMGCGWCFEGQGTGRCVDGPDECAGASFGFTWEPRGCPYVADAGVSDSGAHHDAGAAGDAAPVQEDASAPAADAALPDDASDDGAVPR